MNPLDYEPRKEEQRSGIVVAAYWITLTGTALAAILSLLLGLFSLTDFACVDDPIAPSTRRRALYATGFLCYSAIASVPFRWTGRGTFFWVRWVLLLGPVALMLVRLAQIAPGWRASREGVVGILALLLLSLSPVCSLILRRQMQPSSAGGA